MSLLRFAFVFAVAILCSAHIGDTNTYYRGHAGPYGVQVVVRLPGVIPGLADITIRTDSTRNVSQVLVQNVPASTGIAGAPRPDVARPVAGERGLFAAQLWLMTSGAHSVKVTVTGDAGTGSTFVPVTAVATRVLEMDTTRGIILALLGLLLFAGAVTLVGAAVRDAVLKPGVPTPPERVRKSRIAMGVAAVVLIAAITGGWSWWRSEDANQRARIFRPMHAKATLLNDRTQNAVSIVLDDAEWRAGKRWAPLVPDHGKLMHAFLISSTAFVHVHPKRESRDRFLSYLPRGLPLDRYRLYADVVHEDGFVQTLTDYVDVTTPLPTNITSPEQVTDPDDSWQEIVTAPYIKATTPVAPLPDGMSMIWRHGPDAIVAGKPARMYFAFIAPNGKLAAPEPYMGMTAHAVVWRKDGGVFVHLHPAGNISLGAQERLAASATQPAKADTTRTEHVDTGASHGEEDQAGVVRFPYAFPSPGDYRVFVQMKHGGKVYTAAFDAVVVPDSTTR